MATHQQLHHQSPNSSPIPGHFLPENITITCALCAFLSVALLHYYWSPLNTTEALLSPLPQYITPPQPSSPQQASSLQGRQRCDYSEGRWVRDNAHGPRYNGTTCNVKDSENCIRNGRPDTGYMYWRWQPAQCDLPSFDPSAFLSAIRGKHMAFVGDSMVRNQVESLVCLLSTAFPYELVYRDKEPDVRKFWRWAFPSHNVTVSVYWSPFLVKSWGKSENSSMYEYYNSVSVDKLAARWSAEADTMDIAVLSIGHWFWQATLYYNGSAVLGSHLLPKLNHTEIGFFPAYREVIRKSLERLSSTNASGDRTVVMATFSPSSFEKEWDDLTTCARKEPYKEGVKEVAADEAQMRRIAIEEAAAAAEARKEWLRFEVLDVTKLASMRPDGHPGVYMHRDPFAHGVPKRLTNDCLHFCLPGPVDTFNEILLQLLLKR